MEKKRWWETGSPFKMSKKDFVNYLLFRLGNFENLEDLWPRIELLARVVKVYYGFKEKDLNEFLSKKDYDKDVYGKENRKILMALDKLEFLLKIIVEHTSVEMEGVIPDAEEEVEE